MDPEDSKYLGSMPDRIPVPGIPHAKFTPVEHIPPRFGGFTDWLIMLMLILAVIIVVFPLLP